MNPTKLKAILVLANGSIFEGTSFGFLGDSIGEVCFNTSMTGYQEILTDPSYHGQLITLSYPMIGNYGAYQAANESSKIQAKGLIVKEYVSHPSSFLAESPLHDLLIKHKTPAIESVDTRRLIFILRKEGAQNGGIFVDRNYHKSMLEEVHSAKPMEGLALADEVSTNHPYLYGHQANKKFRIAVIDFGIKTSILRLLEQSNFAIKVFPSRISFEDIQSENFDCYFLSNGPGDPQPLYHAVETIKKILAEGKPLLGICLGHQLIALACGYKRFKLKFGHRGGNHPVIHKGRKHNQVEITSQNHGFAIEREEQENMEISHSNLNDGTVAGFRSLNHPVLCIQYHPESSPGPHDSRYLFQHFADMVEKFYANQT